ncbi:MAG TPA: MOSC domain-containing protein [Candidatus Binatia bacterium]|nr:MOSC domain-containing protein [Candidatus Binatia bacterium]
MAHVAALYRYPVKGFTPEECETLTVLDEGRIAGDRVLGIRFADTEAADDAWSRKHGMVALINTPGLARLRVTFDPKAFRLLISLESSVLVDEVLNPEGRRRIGAVLADYVLKLDQNPLTHHPERLPLRVIGDGLSPRYHDEEPGRVTLHGRGSLQALEAALGEDVSELRFRSNIAVDGLNAWEEQSWVGRRIRIGTVEFEVVKPKTRCLATHANPITGERDLPILTTLVQKMGQENPTFAVAMLPSGRGGQIHVGGQVTLID